MPASYIKYADFVNGLQSRTFDGSSKMVFVPAAGEAESATTEEFMTVGSQIGLMLGTASAPVTLSAGINETITGYEYGSQTDAGVSVNQVTGEITILDPGYFSINAMAGISGMTVKNNNVELVVSINGAFSTIDSVFIASAKVDNVYLAAVYPRPLLLNDVLKLHVKVIDSPQTAVAVISSTFEVERKL